jgi:hypothetical protein
MKCPECDGETTLMGKRFDESFGEKDGTLWTRAYFWCPVCDLYLRLKDPIKRGRLVLLVEEE